MSTLLHRDIEVNSQAFRWNGPIGQFAIDNWKEQESCVLPDSLSTIWLTYGSGDLFESEELYAPDGSDDDIRQMQSLTSDAGEAWPGFVVFHRGAWLVSAIRCEDGVIVCFDRSTSNELQAYDSIDVWYEEAIRPEFAERYGMSK